MRFRGKQAVEHWVVSGQLGVLQQLGFIPMPTWQPAWDPRSLQVIGRLDLHGPRRLVRSADRASLHLFLEPGEVLRHFGKWRRTTRGTSTRPIPWPSQSTVMDSRDRDSESTSTVRSTRARIGPLMPRTDQAHGGRTGPAPRSRRVGRILEDLGRRTVHVDGHGGQAASSRTPA